MRFLLIHGSWHGAWCWHKITSRLLTQNHQVIAVDLPGRGRSPAKTPFVGLSRMVEHAAKHLSDKEQTTVVVHSRYGVLASQLAKKHHRKSHEPSISHHLCCQTEGLLLTIFRQTLTPKSTLSWT